jgi:hypothetical protein
MTNSLLRAEMGENAARYAQDFAWDVIARRLVRVYENVKAG